MRRCAICRAVLLVVMAAMTGFAIQQAVTAQATTQSHVCLPPVLHTEDRIQEDAPIAFLSYRDGSLGLYTVRPDGTGLRYLAPASYESAAPRWSPDRARIAFGCAEGGAICVVGTDGSSLRTLVASQATGDPPSWSPDGKAIAYVSDADGYSEIYIVNTESGAVTNLTNHPAQDSQPDWSPDGELIAFLSDRSGSSAVHTMRADGSDVRRVTTGEPYGDCMPAWSPDGSRIAFGRQGDGLFVEGIVLLDRDGQTEVRIGSGWPYAGPFRWSPDATAIAFGLPHLTGKCSTISTLYSSDSEGEWDVRGVAGCGHSHAWSPDGSAIAYVYGLDSSIQIVDLGPDGVDRRITNHPGFDRSLAWATR